jgi:hypothetical protein
MIDNTGTRETPYKSIEIDQQAAKSFARYDEAILVVVPSTKNKDKNRETSAYRAT